jgi:hypothetical protein
MTLTCVPPPPHSERNRKGRTRVQDESGEEQRLRPAVEPDVLLFPVGKRAGHIPHRDLRQAGAIREGPIGIAHNQPLRYALPPNVTN